MPTPSDLVELARAVAQQRDRAAFATLFKHFAPRVKSYLLRIGCDDSVAEDLAQETLVAVWRKAAGYDPRRAGLSTWIFTIARNLRIDHLRRRVPGASGPDGASPGHAAADDPAGFEPDAADGTAPAAEELVEIEQRDRRLREALGALPPEQSLLLRLSFFDGLPHASIARHLSLPLGTVKSRIRLAVTHLRRAMAPDEP